MQKKKQLKMTLKSVFIAALLLVVAKFCLSSDEVTTLEAQHNLMSMLSFTEIRNVTIVMEVSGFTDMLLRSLNDFIANENCFLMNFYLNSEDRVVRIRRGDDLGNIIEINSQYFDYRRVVKIIDRLHQEAMMNVDAGIKQTFVTVGLASKIGNVFHSLRKITLI